MEGSSRGRSENGGNGGSRATRVRIHPADSLAPDTVDVMWEIYHPHHNITRGEFDQRLKSLDMMALFHACEKGRSGSNDRRAGIVGFTGLRNDEMTTSSGRRVATICLGVTFIENAWRGSNLMQRVVLKQMVRPWLSPRYHRVYFWTDCLSYRPYLVVAHSVGEYYPCPYRETPPEVEEVIRWIGRNYYGDAFDETRGIVRKVSPRLVACDNQISEEDLRDRHIRFFAQRNANYSRGDGMIAIYPVSFSNLVFYVRRQVGSLFKRRAVDQPLARRVA